MTRAKVAATGLNWMRLARSAWYGLFAAACAVFLASLPGFAVLFEEGLYPEVFVVEAFRALTGLTLLIVLGVALSSLVLAWLLFRRGASESTALAVSVFLLLHAVSTTGLIGALEPLLPGSEGFNDLFLGPLMFIPEATVFALFPDGRFVPPWTRRLLIAALALTPLAVFVPRQLIGAGPGGNPYVALAVTTSLMIPVLLAFLYAQIHRYRHVSTPVQRQQTKWVLYGLGLWLVLGALAEIPWMYFMTLPPGSTLPAWAPFTGPIWALETAAIPVTLSISVLRYRLYDIDLIINRTIVYAVLTALIVAIYGLTIAAFGSLFRSNLIVAVLVTAVAAILFQPLRARLQRGVNHLMYGERDDPYTVLARLSRRLEVSLAPGAALSDVVETVAKALKLPYVAVVFNRAAEPAVVASFGLPSSNTLNLPLKYQGEELGKLRAARRGPADDFTPAERTLLEDVAVQVSAAAHAVRLTDDLQRAREQLVTGHAEERRRLRRDLHDGLGPALAALNLQAGALRQLMHADPGAAEALVTEMKAEIRSTIGEVRRLVYGLRPPVLDELGLVEAIRSLTSQVQRERVGDQGLAIELQAPEAIPPLPAAVEVAAYRIVQEAVANVVHHAGATHCLVSLEFQADLVLLVDDDGVGLPAERSNGVGLISMRERAEELGGSLRVESIPERGTRVRAVLPLEPM